MSRIERALERAVRMRDSAIETAAGERTGPVSEGPRPEEGRTAIALPIEYREVAVNASAVDKHLVCITDVRSYAAEQYRRLRTRIMKAAGNGSGNAIMVTSSEIGEGKTITSINLASAFAGLSDLMVVLVDADLRNPSVHKYLGIEAEYGLSDFLMGRAALSDILVKTCVGSLFVVPAGSPPENPSELLSSQKMKDLVQELKRRIGGGYVFFDSPPLLLTADANTLAGFMDGTIFVIRSDQTPERTAERAVTSMGDCPIMGVVLNGMPQYLMKKYRSYYKYPTSAYVKSREDGSAEHLSPGREG